MCIYTDTNDMCTHVLHVRVYGTASAASTASLMHTNNKLSTLLAIAVSGVVRYARHVRCVLSVRVQYHVHNCVRMSYKHCLFLTRTITCVRRHASWQQAWNACSEPEMHCAGFVDTPWLVNVAGLRGGPQEIGNQYVMYLNLYIYSIYTCVCIYVYLCT